jgi:hypothetical protein
MTQQPKSVLKTNTIARRREDAPNTVGRLREEARNSYIMQVDTYRDDLF